MYPFWLRGHHAPQCGYPTFGVTCDDPTGTMLPSLSESYLSLLDINYGNRSVVAIHSNLVSGEPCPATRINVSSSLRLSQLAVSGANWELFFSNNCSRAPPSPAGALWLNCSGAITGTWSVHLGRRYAAGPAECQYSAMPVLPGLELRSWDDYTAIVRRGFLLDWMVPGDCAACKATGGQCRFEAGTNVFGCLCPGGDMQLAKCGELLVMIPISACDIVTALTSAAAALLFPCIYVLIWYMTGKRNWLILWKKKSSSTERHYEAMIVLYGSLAPKRYTYSEVMKMTSSRHKRLGQGGYGVVFEGKLHDGRLVAVKFLQDCKGNGEEFVNEVMSIGRTSYVNVVRRFGFCLEGSKRALIYEYMCNGSLERYIYSENPKEILGWERLYAIAIGIAHGLEYLHHSCNTRIVHFDIKPQNILLDKDFGPKIADFGLAQLCRTKESKLSMVGARGTIGFIVPEVH
ncbi:hypothetical protein CFC21_039429 [Triticum aestivum]|uniref:non-specific serine/threonine protein kinase n=2 Tax=Triticum aestivum TaxID=4565 RepID=A0A9R1JS13_WHEAT|nr:hypothetical protein CFC21_039429 [Triticum aestivum]CDM80899.1 unnamed protein product [Triticum aestivum]